MATVPVVTATTSRTVLGKIFATLGFMKFFKFLAVFFFIIIPLIQAGMVATKADDIVPGLNHIEPIFLEPTLNLQTNSLIIIEQGGLASPGLNPFSWTKETIIMVWKILQSVWIIWKWIWLLYLLYLKIVIQNVSMETASFTFAIITFYLLSALVLFTIGPEELTASEIWKLPYQAVVDFFMAFLEVIKTG